MSKAAEPLLPVTVARQAYCDIAFKTSIFQMYIVCRHWVPISGCCAHTNWLHGRMDRSAAEVRCTQVSLSTRFAGSNTSN